jgi:hypothetical protein
MGRIKKKLIYNLWLPGCPEYPTLYVSRRLSRRSGGGTRCGRSRRRSSRRLAELPRPHHTSFDDRWVPDIGAERSSPGGRMNTHEGSGGGRILELLLLAHLPADEGRVLLLLHSTVHPLPQWMPADSAGGLISSPPHQADQASHLPGAPIAASAPRRQWRRFSAGCALAAVAAARLRGRCASRQTTPPRLADTHMPTTTPRQAKGRHRPRAVLLGTGVGR